MTDRANREGKAIRRVDREIEGGESLDSEKIPMNASGDQLSSGMFLWQVVKVVSFLAQGWA